MKRIALLSLAVISCGTLSLFGQFADFGQHIKAALAKTNPEAAQAWENHEQALRSIKDNIRTQLQKPGANQLEVLSQGVDQVRTENEKFRNTIDAIRAKSGQAPVRTFGQVFGEDIASAAQRVRERAAAAGQQPTLGETMRSLAQGSQS